MAAVVIAKRATGKGHLTDVSETDTVLISGLSRSTAAPATLYTDANTTSVTIGRAAITTTVASELQVDQTIFGPSDGTGIVIGSPGASPSTGSALQIQTFTATQQGNLVAANGMLVYNSTTPDVEAYVNGSWVGLGASSNVSQFSMALGGRLSRPSLPLSGAGAEIAKSSYTITSFKARRGVAGSSGTTTIQLELNGTAIGGATLSWASTDVAFTLKTIALSQAIVAGDRVSFRLTAVEGGDPQDVYAEAN